MHICCWCFLITVRVESGWKAWPKRVKCGVNNRLDKARVGGVPLDTDSVSVLSALFGLFFSPPLIVLHVDKAVWTS